MTGYKKSEILILFLLSLVTMNFFSKQFYWSYAVFIVYVVAFKKVYVDLTTLLYVFFGLLYSMYSLYDSGFALAIKRLAFPMFYIVGYGISVSRDTKVESLKMRENMLCACIVSFMIGSFVHFALNFIMNFGSGLGRNMPDVWSKEIMSATGQGSIACVVIGVCSAWFIFPRKPIHRYCAFFVTLVVLAYNLQLACRTVFLIYFLTMLTDVLYLSMIERRFQKKTLFRAFVILLMVVVIFSVISVYNPFGSSNLFSRFEGTDVEDLTFTGRTENKINYILNLHKYPFGGNHMNEMWGFAHDLLLDTYDEAGFATALLLLFILVTSLVKIKKFLFVRSVTTYTKVLLLSVFVSIFILFFMEPIFTATPWVFLCYALIHGSTCGLLDSERRVLYSY